MKTDPSFDFTAVPVAIILTAVMGTMFSFGLYAMFGFESKLFYVVVYGLVLVWLVVSMRRSGLLFK